MNVGQKDNTINMNGESDKHLEVHEKSFLPLQDYSVNELRNLCRICANPNERIIGIYSEEGLSNELSNKMNLYLPITVSENDTLPLQCCWSCASTILAWHELVVVSVETDRRLRGILHVDDNKSESTSIYENFEATASPLVPDERFQLNAPAASLNVFCQEQSLDTRQPKSIQSKRKQQFNNNKKQYLVHCNVIADETLLKYLENIQNPLLESNVAIDPSEENSDSPSIIIPYPLKDKSLTRCTEAVETVELTSTCTNSTENSEYEKDPLLITPDAVTKKEYDFSCQYCTSMFVNEDDILEHVKTAHSNKHLQEEVSSESNKKKIRCRRLDQSIVNAAKVVIEGRVYYNCKMCGKILHSPYTYIWHIRIHTGERPYVCDLCGKQFRISQGLVRHVKETHQGVKNFGCDICGRMFATRRNVQEHRRIHTNERPYICDLCGKSFKQKASLFVHNRSHSNSYPFTCTYCNQGFRTRPPLLIHMTRHTGEKPYPCDVCGRFFRIKYELKRHKLIHSEEKPFSCAECGLHFRQKRYLKNHNKTNHKQILIQLQRSI